MAVSFLAEKVLVHRWPHNTPLWDDSVRKGLDDAISKNPEPKMVTVSARSVSIRGYEFTHLKKIGISVPFFKDECRMIFECRFGGLFAHVHITARSPDYIDVFARLKSWKSEFFPHDSNR